MQRLGKKAQATMAVGSIITLIVGIAVAVLVLIFAGALGGQTYELVEDQLDAIGSTAIVNDSFTALYNESVSLSHTDIETGTLVITNSSGSTIPASNYTANLTAGTITLDESTLNNTAMLASYRYDNSTIRNTIKNGIVSGFEALEQTGSYLPIIVLAVVISLVLMLVLSFTNVGGGMGSRGSAL